jgi:hypothetical protein
MIRQAYEQMGARYKNLCDMMLIKEQEQIYSQQLAQVLNGNP